MAILIYDIGKTNKKAFVFDDVYQILWKKSEHFEEVLDEDGEVCEDLQKLTEWVKIIYTEVETLFDIKAINFSCYGASLVYLDKNKKPIFPLYNYLKPYPETLKSKFYSLYEGEEEFSRKTASPILGSLNSGMQIYRLKQKKSFSQVRYILHLPNYMSSLFSGRLLTDVTSLGCHTNLWNFEEKRYHNWVEKEEILGLFSPIVDAKQTSKNDKGINIGSGLHDSSAALIPYLQIIKEPFVLLSTGTWNICFNPFNEKPLTPNELENDTLCYLRIDEKPIKASRLLAGMYHEKQCNRIAKFFGVESHDLWSIKYDSSIVFYDDFEPISKIKNPLENTDFEKRELSYFKNIEEAYHYLMYDLVKLQAFSLDLVLDKEKVRQVFVDGGFGQNDIFIKLLKRKYPEISIQASDIPQASAIGAALAIHKSWNLSEISNNIIRFY